MREVGHPSDTPPARLTYRVNEVAAMLGVSPRTVNRAINDGSLQSTKALGMRLVFAASVAALLERPAGYLHKVKKG